MPATISIAVLLSFIAAPVASQAPPADGDWPHFGGPRGDSTAPALSSKFAWGEKGPAVLWRTKTGPGFGGAAVQGGEVFLFDCELGAREMLRVFDLASGAEKWHTDYEAKGRVGFPGSRTVPTVTADAVYTCGAFGHVTCFDRATHEIRWMEHLAETYGGEDPGFGWSSAPILIGDKVVFTTSGPEVGLVALDAKTGEERWTSASIGYTQSTPALLSLLGQEQLVVLSTAAVATGQDLAAPMTITSIDPKNGKTLWQHVITLTRLPVAAALRIDDERIFVTGGYRAGSTLLHITKKDGAYAFEEVFHSERGASVHEPLRLGDCVYLLANENWNEPRNRRSEGGLVCLGLDGKERWRTGDSPYFGRGNALLAGEHLLIQDAYDGTLRVVHASPERYDQVAEAKLFPANGTRDGQMWAPMALAGEKLLLRSQDELLCVQL